MHGGRIQEKEEIGKLATVADREIQVVAEALTA